MAKASKPTKQAAPRKPADIVQAFGSVIGGWSKWSTARNGRKPTRAEFEAALTYGPQAGHCKRGVGREALALAMYLRSGYGATDIEARRLGLPTLSGGFNRNVRRDAVNYGVLATVDHEPRVDKVDGKAHQVFELGLPQAKARKARTPRKPADKPVQAQAPATPQPTAPAQDANTDATPAA